MSDTAPKPLTDAGLDELDRLHARWMDAAEALTKARQKKDNGSLEYATRLAGNVSADWEDCVQDQWPAVSAELRRLRAQCGTGATKRAGR